MDLAKINILLDYSKYIISTRYTGWKYLAVTNGDENKGKSPSEIKARLSYKCRGLNIIDGFWLTVAYPKILKNMQ